MVNNDFTDFALLMLYIYSLAEAKQARFRRSDVSGSMNAVADPLLSFLAVLTE